MPATSSAIQLADLALTWSITIGDADLSLIDSDLASDAGLETAAMLSLFTDRRALPDDVRQGPNGPDGFRGWWADQFAAVEGDRIGSRLWLLDRSVLSKETVRRAEEYAREALAWMLEDRVVSGIDVAIETVVDRMFIGVTLHRPGREAVSFRFAHVWDAFT